MARVCVARPFPLHTRLGLAILSFFFFLDIGPGLVQLDFSELLVAKGGEVWGEAESGHYRRHAIRHDIASWAIGTVEADCQHGLPDTLRCHCSIPTTCR